MVPGAAGRETSAANGVPAEPSLSEVTIRKERKTVGVVSGIGSLRLDPRRDRIPTNNAAMRPSDLRIDCRLDEEGERLLKAATQQLGLSARAYHRLLKLARTIADLSAEERIESKHLAEALQYRPRE
jgi:predicted ATPase with chaperone activity